MREIAGERETGRQGKNSVCVCAWVSACLRACACVCGCTFVCGGGGKGNTHWRERKHAR